MNVKLSKRLYTKTMRRASKLIIINYAMDSKSSIFAHQYETAQGLVSKFSAITVFTNEKGLCPDVKGMRVVEVGWIEKEPIRNVIRLLTKILPTLLRKNYDSVFFHMTDLHAAIFSPIIKILGKRQVLWYAHAHPSLRLRWSEKWVDLIASSTTGSCTLSSKKVALIGQAIKQESFPFSTSSCRSSSKRIVHFGRFDQGKQISELLETCQILRDEGFDLSFTQIGKASNSKNQAYGLEVISNYSKFDWARFLPPIERSQLSRNVKKFSVFLHGFQGSLDKTLIESTFLGLPVATINNEYLNIFGQWSDLKPTNLVAELRAVLEMDSVNLEREIRKRRLIAVDNHSFEKWIDKLGDLLTDASKTECKL